MHPSSVNHVRRRPENDDQRPTVEKQIFAFSEKVRTVNPSKKPGKAPSETLSLRSTTRLDPLGYMLFGTNKLRVNDQGLEGDGWLPIVVPRGGDVAALDQVERLKAIFDASLLRVFEGLNVAIARGRRGDKRAAPSGPPPPPPSDTEDEAGIDEPSAAELNDPALSGREIEDLSRLTSGVAELLKIHAKTSEFSRWASSRPSSRSSFNRRNPSPTPSPSPGVSDGWKGPSFRQPGLQQQHRNMSYWSRPSTPGFGGGGGSWRDDDVAAHFRDPRRQLGQQRNWLSQSRASTPGGGSGGNASWRDEDSGASPASWW
jgi:hypothetical protein